MRKTRSHSLRERARQHIRERGIWYLVGEAIVLAITMPGFYGEFGWSLDLFRITLIMLGIWIIASVIIFAMFMVASRPPHDTSRRT